MEKIDIGEFSSDERLNLILDNTLNTRALLENIIFPDSLENSKKYDNDVIAGLFKDNLEYLCSNDTMDQKILQAVIFNQALVQRIAFMYITDLCKKNPQKSIDEVEKEFSEGVERIFYELCAKIMGAKKETLEPGNTNIGSSNNE
jgi:hypothetical protein